MLAGESTGGSMGTRSWIGAWDVNTGAPGVAHLHDPGPGRARPETWKDNHNAWRIGGAQRLADRRPTIRPPTSTMYGTGDAFPTFDPEFRPGDNLYTGEHASRSTPTPARSPGTSRRRRTSIGTSTRRARRCSTRPRSTARPARWWRTSRATASTTRSIAPTASSSAPTSIRRR